MKLALALAVFSLLGLSLALEGALLFDLRTLPAPERPALAAR